MVCNWIINRWGFSILNIPWSHQHKLFLCKRRFHSWIRFKSSKNKILHRTKLGSLDPQRSRQQVGNSSGMASLSHDHQDNTSSRIRYINDGIDQVYESVNNNFDPGASVLWKLVLYLACSNIRFTHILWRHFQNGISTLQLLRQRFHNHDHSGAYLPRLDVSQL